MKNFEKINDNIQERLRALEAQNQVFCALVVSMIETHPRPDALRKQFDFHFESLNSRWLNSQISEDWIDAANLLRQALSSAFDRPRV